MKAENDGPNLNALPESSSGALLDRLEVVVAELADPMEWNWTRGTSDRDAADSVLRLMARAKVIEHRRHPSGGDIWKVNGKLYGRLDDITLEKFDALAV